MPTKYEKEIVDLHQFFEDWFTGKIDKNPEDGARLEDVTADNFYIIASDGRITPREILIPALYNAHGQHSDFRIWIESVVLRQQHDNISVVTYEEWQSTNGKTTTRTSTVIFQDSPTAPNQLMWLYVHESGLRSVEETNS